MSYNKIQKELALRGNRQCYSCKEILKENNFYPSVLKRHIYICIICMKSKAKIHKKNWRKNNPEKYKLQKQNYLKRFKEKYGFNPTNNNKTRRLIIEEVNFRCEHCGLHKPDGYSFFDIDHIKPIRRRGSRWRQGMYKKESRKNLQVLCPNCHRIKTILEGYR